MTLPVADEAEARARLDPFILFLGVSADPAYAEGMAMPRWP